MKKIIYIIIIVFFVFNSIVYGEVDNDNILNDQIDILNIKGIEKILEDTLDDKEMSIKFDTKDFIMNLIKGKTSFSFKDIGKSVVQFFFKELGTSLILLAKILVITLISSILTNLQSSFENGSVAELANYISYVLIGILVISSFSQAMELATSTIYKMVGFMQAILPILLTMLIAVSGPNTRTLFHPMIITIVNFIGILVKNIILPLIFFSFIISVISNISSRIEFSKLSELAREVIGFIITGALTLFIGIITIYGLSSKIDGLTIRTAKFAVDKFIPIVGGFLSDAVEAVVGCSAILKNALGFIGLLTLLLICVLPIVKILVLMFMYKIIAVIIQPIGSENLVEFFNQVSKSLLLVLISLISTATMFFITITIIVEAGNNLLMLR